MKTNKKLEGAIKRVINQAQLLRKLREGSTKTWHPFSKEQEKTLINLAAGVGFIELMLTEDDAMFFFNASQKAVLRDIFNPWPVMQALTVANLTYRLPFDGDQHYLLVDILHELTRGTNVAKANKRARYPFTHAQEQALRDMLGNETREARIQRKNKEWAEKGRSSFNSHQEKFLIKILNEEHPSFSTLHLINRELGYPMSRDQVSVLTEILSGLTITEDK